MLAFDLAAPVPNDIVRMTVVPLGEFGLRPHRTGHRGHGLYIAQCSLVTLVGKIDKTGDEDEMDHSALLNNDMGRVGYSSRQDMNGIPSFRLQCS